MRFVLLAWLLPAILSYVVYFGFNPDLSGSVFSSHGFSAKYDHGIYRYRVLGVGLLRLTHRVVSATGLPVSAPKMLPRADPTFATEIYSAFFYMNTLLLCLTASVLFVVVSRLEPERAATVVDLALIVLAGMMALSQYVVVPYDMLSYLFLAIATYLVFWGPRNSRTLVLLSAVVVLAALTRETAAIILALYAAVHLDSVVHPPRPAPGLVSPRLSLAVLTLCFLATYAGLRAWLGADTAFFDAIRLRQNLTQTFSIVGGVFFLAAVALGLFRERARRTTRRFLVASSPYWIAMFLIANPREIRLWVPVLIPLLLVQLRGDDAEDGQPAAHVRT